ncbi:MAG: SUMF1/EgtB/PvdO family nonheme iron enzyme, partial [bacterium]|nr:SUMF1/EgtB/PvdO family nonheme iron enzyme [bacterium]
MSADRETRELDVVLWPLRGESFLLGPPHPISPRRHFHPVDLRQSARGNEGRPYPWGDDPPSEELANYNVRIGRTTPVGAYPAGVGPYGTLDQAGNVWEWCFDQYDSDAYRDRDGQRDPVVEPKDDSDEGAVRALRGGAWNNPSRNLHAAIRNRNQAGNR